MLLYIASVFVPVRILYPIVHIYSSTCVSRVQNLGKIGGKTWRKVGGKTWGKLERGGEICRKVRRVFVGRCGERGGESCRKVRRVVVGRCGEKGGEICRKMRRVFVGRCRERGRESCRKMW